MQFRNLPSVDVVLADQALAEPLTAYRRDWVVGLVRHELEQARQSIRRGGDAPSAEQVAAVVNRNIGAMLEPTPRHLINATGVIMHTNLGRAPLSPAAIKAAKMASVIRAGTR